eukprot:SAG11_NODE_4573_length_1846_cov_0.831712_3_plen_182_part_00
MSFYLCHERWMLCTNFAPERPACVASFATAGGVPRGEAIWAYADEGAAATADRALFVIELSNAELEAEDLSSQERPMSPISEGQKRSESPPVTAEAGFQPTAAMPIRELLESVGALGAAELDALEVRLPGGPGGGRSSSTAAHPITPVVPAKHPVARRRSSTTWTWRLLEMWRSCWTRRTT